MASAAELAADGSNTAPVAQRSLTAFIDRWIWVFMAALFVVTALVGFVPDSIAKVGLVEAGARPAFPPILHVHAVLMGSWLVLLLSQATLMATGHSAWHKQLGMASFGLAPVIVVAGFILVPTIYHANWAAAQGAPAARATEMHGRVALLTNLVLLQLRAGFLFPIYVSIALWARRHDLGLHKRMMLLATLAPLPASIQRMQWLPTTIPGSPLALSLYALVLITPLFLWDLYRLRRVHGAYLIWLALFVPTGLAVELLWNSRWWFATVPRLMGVA
jgi:hypothetical protein